MMNSSGLSGLVLQPQDSKSEALLTPLWLFYVAWDGLVFTHRALLPEPLRPHLTSAVKICQATAAVGERAGLDHEKTPRLSNRGRSHQHDKHRCQAQEMLALFSKPCKRSGTWINTACFAKVLWVQNKRTFLHFQSRCKHNLEKISRQLILCHLSAPKSASCFIVH